MIIAPLVLLTSPQANLRAANCRADDLLRAALDAAPWRRADQRLMVAEREGTVRLAGIRVFGRKVVPTPDWTLDLRIGDPAPTVAPGPPIDPELRKQVVDAVASLRTAVPKADALLISAAHRKTGWWLTLQLCWTIVDTSDRVIFRWYDPWKKAYHTRTSYAALSGTKGLPLPGK